MPRPSQAAKDAAFRSQTVAATVASSAGGAAAASALIPVAGPFIAAGFGVVGAAFGIRVVVQGKIVHDPPREDFSRPTTLAEPQFDVTVLGDSPVERAAADLTIATDESARALEAMLVAIERAAGAELVGDYAMIDARVTEALEFAQQASSRLTETSDHMGPMQRALEELRDGPLVPEPGGSLESQLPNSTLDMLLAMGVPQDYLLLPVEGGEIDPIGLASEAFGRTAETDYEFGLYLRGAVSDGTLLEGGVPG